jgi:hypothetical protein
MLDDRRVSLGIVQTCFVPSSIPHLSWDVSMQDLAMVDTECSDQG